MLQRYKRNKEPASLGGKLHIVNSGSYFHTVPFHTLTNACKETTNSYMASR